MISEIFILTIGSMLLWWGLSLFGFYQLPFKVHIHHFYLGAVLVLVYFFIETRLLMTLGIALMISDVCDHLFFINLREKINRVVVSFI